MSISERLEVRPTPLFSVVIPAYHSARHIEETVQSALRQTISDIEIIIVCDPSEDSTAEIIEKLSKQDERIILIKNDERAGVAESRNIGMAKARGEYIAFLDADDIWYENKLSKQHEIIKSTNCDMCYSSYSFIDANGKSTGQPFIVKEKIDFRGLLYGNIIGTSTCVVSQKIAKKHRMDGRYYVEDFVFWLSLTRAGYIARGTLEVLTEYRLTPGSRSRNKLQLAKARWDTYRGFLDLNVFTSFWYTSIGGIRAMSKYIGAR